MKNIVKRIICIALVSALMVNTNYSRAVSIIESDENSELQEIYIDGVKYDISFDIDDGTIKIKGEESDTNLYAEMILDSNQTEATIINDGEKEHYNIEIEELSKEGVDVEVYDEKGVVESFESKEELLEDKYDGQMIAIGTTIIIASLIAVVLASTYIIVHNNKTYISVDKFYDSISNAVTKVKREAKEWYYPAWVDTSSHKTWILPTKMNKSMAAGLICSNADVYSFTNSMAKNVIKAAGYLPYSSETTVGEYHTSNCSKRFVYRHWHKANVKTKKREQRNCHSLYGIPIYVK